MMCHVLNTKFDVIKFALVFETFVEKTILSHDQQKCTSLQYIFLSNSKFLRLLVQIFKFKKYISQLTLTLIRKFESNFSLKIIPSIIS